MAHREGQTLKKPTHLSKPRTGHNSILQHLGVSDLRQVLDRKRNERGHVEEAGVPPPDPSYSYLKDPLRENANEHASNSNATKKHHNSNVRREKEKAGHKNRDIENPCNIKVEFSTETGRHSYKLEEGTVLPTIKHVPDRLPTQNRLFRGRGRGPRSYHTRTIRNNAANQRGDVSQHFEKNWDDECNTDRETNEKDVEYEDALDGDLERGIADLQIAESGRGTGHTEEKKNRFS